MKTFLMLAVLCSLVVSAAGQSTTQFVPLFNGKNLAAWVNVNTAEDTWKVRNPANT
jgi:hypothetical protein